MTAQAKRDIRRKLKVLKYVEERGDVSKACRYFGISRQSYYTWKKRWIEQGEEGLIKQIRKILDHDNKTTTGSSGLLQEARGRLEVDS